MSFTVCVGDNDYQRGHSYYFPIELVPTATQSKVPKKQLQMPIGGGDPPGTALTANLSLTARQYLVSLGIPHPDAGAKTAGLLWMHALAIGYSRAYLEENRDGIRQKWPRIPLPKTRKALESSAALGEQAAALLDTERDVPGVTAGGVRPDLGLIGAIQPGGRRPAPIGRLGIDGRLGPPRPEERGHAREGQGGRARVHCG